MSKPKVLVFTSTYPRWSGDVEPGFVHQLNLQLKQHFTVHTLCPHFSGALTDELIDGVHVHRFRYQFSFLEKLVNDGGIISNLKANPLKWLLVPFYLLGQFFSLGLLVKKLKPDAIHAHWIVSQGLVYSLLSIFMVLPPMLVTSHGGDLFTLRSKFWVIMKKWVLNRASEITVVSRAMKDNIVSMGIDAEKIKVVSMGVDFTDTFLPSEDVVRVPGKILFVGRLVEKKGVTYLLNAMAKIINKIPKAQLHIIGNGPEKNNLQRRVEQLGLDKYVCFYDAMPQKDLVEYYQSSCLFIAPFIEALSGDQEGLGLVTLEALACGTPSLVGDVPAVRDIFDEESDYIVNAKDSDNLSEKVIQMIEYNRDYLQKSIEVRRKMEKRFSWSAVGEKYSNILMEVIE